MMMIVIAVVVVLTSGLRKRKKKPFCVIFIITYSFPIHSADEKLSNKNKRQSSDVRRRTHGTCAAEKEE